MLILILCIAGSAQLELSTECGITLNSDKISSLVFYDGDRNGKKDIIIGTTMDGLVQSYEYEPGKCRYQWDSTHSYSTKGGVEQLVLADVDSDNRFEIIVNGAKSRKSHPTNPTNYVASLNAKTFTEEWRDREDCQQTTTLTVADLTDDRNPNIIAAGSRKVCAYEDLKNDNARMLWSYETSLPVFHLKALDVEGDEDPEILVVSTTREFTVLEILDKNGMVKWRKNISNGLFTASGRDIIQVADLDADGLKDIILAHKDSVTAFSVEKGILWHYKPKTGEDEDVIATSLALIPQWKNVLIGAKGSLTNLNYDGTIRWISDVEGSVYSIDVGNIDRDVKPEILLGAYQALYVFDLYGNMITWLYQPTQGVGWSRWDESESNYFTTSAEKIPVTHVKANDVDGDGHSEVVAVYTTIPSGLGRSVKTILDVFEVEMPREAESTTSIRDSTTTLQDGKTAETAPDTPMPDDDAVEPETSIDEQDPEEDGKRTCCCIPLLPLIIIGAGMLFTGTPIE